MVWYVPTTDVIFDILSKSLETQNNKNNKQRPRIIIFYPSREGSAGGEGHPSDPQARPLEGRPPYL